MCGYGLISVNRIRRLAEGGREGDISAKEAVHDIAAPCVCGIVNMERAESVFVNLEKISVIVSIHSKFLKSSRTMHLNYRASEENR